MKGPLIIIKKKTSGTATADRHSMNPKAEALKRRTFQFGLRTVRFCRHLRTSWEGRQFADQLFRSGTSVGANYRSACRGRSHAEFVAKLGVVVEEVDETIYWLDLVAAAGLTLDPELEGLRQEAGELFAIFTASQMTARRRVK